MMETAQKKIVRAVLTVKEKVFVSPHYIRVIFGMSDEQTDQFRNMRIGDHNKIFIPAEGVSDINIKDEGIWDSDLFIARRTYTARNIDAANKEMWIDFVVHGDNGPASHWAQRATKGSILGVAMKEGSRPLFPQADKYWLVGDSTALPVIGAILEQLPSQVNVDVTIEVHGKEDEIVLYSKAPFNIEWLHNPRPEKGSPLARIIRSKPLLQGRRFLFIAAEYATVKDLRNYFKAEKAWLPGEYAATAYWQCGSSEDQSSVLRRMERREQLPGAGLK